MLDIEELVELCQQAGEEWAGFSSAYHRFDTGFKSKFAEVKDLVRRTQTPAKGKFTRDELEDAALIHPDWKKFLDDMENSYEAMLRSKVKYDTYKNAFEATRSKMADARSEKWK